MVTPTCCAPSGETGRQRYSRACPPYSFHHYPERRLYHSPHDSRSTIMTEREESDQPRKRIAVACGRCRKRKIRCSGDPGNGAQCSNCKSAGYEPCLFLRVSSTETALKDGSGSEYGYNLEAARSYQSRGTVSHMVSVPSYSPEDVMSYRQGSYPYTSGGGSTGKGYYQGIPSWSAAYPDDGSVDYNIAGYSSYPMITQDTTPIAVSAYHPYTASSRKSSVYQVEESAAAATAPYSYTNLTHRPAAAASSDTSHNFSLSGMAASLPTPADRTAMIPSSDRLHSQVNRTLTSSSSSSYHRGDGLPGGHHYSSSSASKAAVAAAAAADVGYSQHSTFEAPYSTNAAEGDPYGDHDAAVAYNNSSYSHTGGSGSGGGSRLDRRDSTLPNGHAYHVPESSSTYHVQASSQHYVQSGSGSGGGSARNGSGSSHRPSSDGHHRRSAGSLRGG
ncbi:hypothetical protein F5Y16DRAFT_53115 [Xylariaceae sp. FL0255]|nr:hypothetical protein F5Y16DRAFT_53115 [Xylariaceae sp. FL0255]